VSEESRSPVPADQTAAAPRAGQVSVVTGGSAGLGLAIAGALARAGSAVVIASRSAERCEQAAGRLTAQTGRPALGHGCDVTDEDAVAGLVDRVLSAYGRLDVLVTSAGVQAWGTIDELSVAGLRACLEVNVVGTWLACCSPTRSPATSPAPCFPSMAAGQATNRGRTALAGTPTPAARTGSGVRGGQRAAVLRPARRLGTA
jgi:short chain dehydrogenase